MTWRQRTTDILADYLRFSVRGLLLVNGIILAAASIYLTLKLCWFTLRYLDRVWFGSAW